MKWDGDAFLDMTVGGGSSQKVVSAEDAGNELQILVPWARRDLQVVVDPNEVYGPTDYTLTVKRTTVVADRDQDGVPDVADNCRRAAGPSAGGGCPDTDADSLFDKDDACPTVAGDGFDGCPTRAGEKVVVYVDGKKVGSNAILTEHGAYDFSVSAPVGAGKHKLVLKWLDGKKVVKKVSRIM